MSELPEGWASATLGEVTAPRGEKASPSDLGDLPFVGLEEVEAHTGRIVRMQTTAGLKSAVALFGKGDLLYGRLRPYLNKVVLAQNDGAASAEFIVFPPSAAVDQSYLQRTLMSPEFVQFTGLRSTGDRPRVSFDAVSDYVLPLPPLPEQRRIVAKIDSLTGKSRRARDHLDHIPRLVEKYKQAVLAAAFRGDLTEVGSADLLPLGDFIQSLDQGWSPKCEPEPAAPGEWAVIKTTAIQPVDFLAGENKRLPSHLEPRPDITIRAGDVVVTRAGPRSRVAISCVVAEDHPRLMLCDKAYRLRVDRDRTDPVYLTYMLNSSQCLSALEAMKTGISDSGLNLTQGKFLELPIPAFSKDIQVKIVERVRMALNWIDRLASEATSARRLIDRLDQTVLAKAFRGELVPQDPTDEPASILLERIRAGRGAAPKAKRGRRPRA